MSVTHDVGATFATLPVPCAVLGSDLVVRRASDGYGRVLGRGTDDLVGAVATELLVRPRADDADRAAVRAALDAVVATG